ncbi:beta-D-glucosyl crocetin beta-1 6-glucosyltransferase [Prunus yedoensis var. nudiflora]|uniref:Beta-D-glucosyl crocetin beta-1 6-glucosyltransferase n=1 Tax=Prunus yedoensis var. nudiflora TaxID=2094558 RepID=A0A314UQ58_PRUYE|nr:beta-D-glucosyl crocetin beta-1 6-glucosyltransferase [Prunus yedoensis var. nudiflora]
MELSVGEHQVWCSNYRAMPMHLDQPINSRLVEEAGIGVLVKRTAEGSLQREEVAKVIRDVVVEKIGEGVRKKALEIRDNMKKNEAAEIDGVVEELLQLCTKRGTNVNF